MKSELPEAEDQRKKKLLESLARVLENGVATASDRQRRLIQYLVTEELEGRGDRLKAFSIATNVLGRSADFDPQTDSIVRVEMGRVRQALALYYATIGADDPVQIKFEKGSCRPKFLWSAKAQPARSRWRLWLVVTTVLVAVLAGCAFWFFSPFSKTTANRRFSPVAVAGGPRVAVAPFAYSSDKPGWDFLAAGMHGELVGILAEFDWLTVFPILTDQSIDKLDSNIMERVDYIVRGSAQVANEKLATWVLLTDGKSGAVLWSNRYETALESAGLLDLQRNIGVRIASDIGRPRGIVASLEKTRFAIDNFQSPHGFNCYLRALQFFNTYERADYRDADACAEMATKAASRDGNALALFALLELAGEIYGYDGVTSPERRAAAVKLAEESYRLNDLGSLPRMASYMAAVCEGDEERFRKISALSLRDYPNNPAVLFDVAQRMMLGTGAWPEGVALLERAYKLNSISDPSYSVLKAFDAFQHGQDDETILSALNLGSDPLSPPQQAIEMALRTHANDQVGAERMRRSLQGLGFTHRSDYLDLIDRECWTKKVKEIVRRLLPEN
jgi:adenylate cyclase